MLILTRHFGQSIIIADNIKIQIRGWSRHRHQIEIGIVAPKGVSVHREEIHEKIQAEQRNSQVEPVEPIEASEA